MIGTVVGAVAMVVLTACFPQNRIAFLAGLALWGAGCAFVATILRNSLALAAQLAGITAAIIASSQLGETGGANGDAFVLAVIRCTEICIGIVSAGVVLVGTDFGSAQRRLAALIAEISTVVMRRFVGTLALAGPELPETQRVRRELVRRVIALELGDRRGDRRVRPAPVPFASVADGGERTVRRYSRLAHYGGSLGPTAK